MLHAIHSPRQMPKGPAPSLSTLPGQPHATNLDSLLDGSIHVNPSRSWFPLSLPIQLRPRRDRSGRVAGHWGCVTSWIQTARSKPKAWRAHGWKEGSGVARGPTNLKKDGLRRGRGFSNVKWRRNLLLKQTTSGKNRRGRGRSW